ncbi:fungal transcription factor, partial [Colletotrichum sojae]
AEASATALAELAGAAVAFHVANGLDKPDCQPWLAQATILCQIAAFFGDNKARIEKALAVRATVGHICRRIGCYHDIRDPPDPVMGAGPDSKVSWEGWVHAEGFRRIAFASWLLDSQCCLMLGVTPTILTKLLRSKLPCHESAWNASTPNMWRECIQRYNNYSRVGTLRSELERLYAGEPIPRETGSFARLLILFGTYRDSLFLKQAHDSGLSLVLNTHGQAVSHDDLCKRPVWDLLDPERRDGTGGSMESMIFQSYHLIGLSQYLSVNELYSFSGFEVTPLEQRETTRRLASWCAQNGDSARKAAMHAGRLFSHCQSGPTLRGYQEPRVMLIATLALWAYSTLPLTPLVGPFGRYSPSTCTVTGSSSSDAITTCRIDRLSGDSQTARDWVRSGCHTRCFIEGLGNLHGPNADARIVRRAIALLASLHEWRLGRAIARELKRLFEVFWIER